MRKFSVIHLYLYNNIKALNRNPDSGPWKSNSGKKTAHLEQKETLSRTGRVHWNMWHLRKGPTDTENGFRRKQLTSVLFRLFVCTESYFHCQMVEWRGHYRAVLGYSRLNVLLFKTRKGKHFEQVVLMRTGTRLKMMEMDFYQKWGYQDCWDSRLDAPCDHDYNWGVNDGWMNSCHRDRHSDLELRAALSPRYNLLHFGLPANWKENKQTNKKVNVLIYFKSSI